MALNQTILDTFVRQGREYGRKALEEARNEAFDQLQTGVTLTSLTFGDGGSQAGTPDMPPSQFIEYCEEALQLLDGIDRVDGVFVDHSTATF